MVLVLMASVLRYCFGPDFRAIFESVPGLYLVLSPDLIIVAASEAYLRATMTNRDQILGRHLLAVFPGNPCDPNADDVHDLRASLNRVLRDRRADAMPVKKSNARRAPTEGAGLEERYWSRLNSPVLDQDGKIAYIIHRVENVTEVVRLKQLGRDARDLSEEFRMCGESMGAGVYARGRQLEEVNRQRLESIGRLVGGIAHDFNNLLCVIIGYAKLLQEQQPPRQGPFSKALDQIAQAADRAATLIRQLLAFSRQEVLRTIALDLNLVVAGIEPLIRRLIGEDIQFVTKLSPDLGRVKADPGQIEQVVMNLALNARDAMPDGGRLIVETSIVEINKEDVEEHSKLTPGPYIVLSVIDTGIGISQAIRERIFEPFFTTKEIGKGDGLGLATVHRIVEQIGGSIRVRSAPGIGATFKVYLPRIGEALETVVARPREVVKKGTETILFVEDHEIIRELAQVMLEKDGYTVLAAESPAQALQLAQAHPGTINALVTDVILPGMNGRVLAERLANSRPGLKVLFISGYSANHIPQQAIVESGGRF